MRAHGGDLWLDPNRRGASFSSVWPGVPGYEPGADEPTDPVEFGQAVRKAREARGLTHVAFADRLGVSEGTMKNIEAARHPASAATHHRIVQELGGRVDTRSDSSMMHPDGWPVDPQAFGRAIGQAREFAKLTREQLARLVGVAPSTLQNTEGGIHLCNPRTRAKLVKALSHPSDPPAPATP